MKEFMNPDGTYTSPINNKIYKSEHAIRSHINYRVTGKPSNLFIANKIQCTCQYCGEIRNKPTICRHERGCYLNPVNKVMCKHCQEPIINFRTTKGTCSRSCANSYFRTGEDNGNYKGGESKDYCAICYREHEKQCVICGEQDVVHVHHLDHNRENNKITNLIPLCPTHHAYCYRGLFFKIEDIISKYLIEFNSRSVG